MSCASAGEEQDEDLTAWADLFVRELERALSAIVSPPPVVAGGPWGIPSSLQASAVLVVIATPRWLESERFRKEWEAAGLGSGRDDVAIFVVEPVPAGRRWLPSHSPVTAHYKFHSEVALDPGAKHRPSFDFKAVTALAADIAEVLRPIAKTPAATEQEDHGAYVPFISDAPSDTRDSLDRGPLALFLARRLHLIWCELNGCVAHGGPGASDAGRSRPKRRSEEELPDTFIVHIDAPWGGGKSTFANFLARILDPASRPLSEDDFLRAHVARGVPAGDLPKVSLEGVFRSEWPPDGVDSWMPGWRPWIIVKTNAWRDQFIQPPWWQLFLAISHEVRRAAGADARRGLAACCVPSLDREAARWLSLRRGLDGVRRWAGVSLASFAYRVLNAKVIVQLGLTALGLCAMAAFYILGPRLHLFGAHVKEAELKAGVELAMILLALFGGGGATLAAVFSQSIAPDIDFSDESKSIGVRDPIARFRRTFDLILKLGRRPVLLIVDDLDRCEPARVVEVLRGFQTIIRSPRLFVLVLGDRRWIETAHSVWHKELAGLSVGQETGLGARFVEKLFQLSFTLPAMKPDARRRYTESNLRSGRDAEPAGTQTLTKQSIEARIDEILSAQTSMADREERLNRAIESEGLQGDARERAKNYAVQKLVTAAGSDAGYQRQVRNILMGLADLLPNNPRQIKRVFNAFSVYEMVGRLHFRYQVSDAGQEGGALARRWRQLALWVTLATDWPDTWRAVAKRPALLDAAFGESETQREAITATLLNGLSPTEAGSLTETLRRLRTDPDLSTLLGGLAAAKSGVDARDLFAATALDSQAVYEFNRIMWEPGFPLTQAGGPM